MTESAERDIAYIRSVIELLESTGLTELALRRSFAEGGSLDLRLKRAAGGGLAAQAAPVEDAAALAPPPAAPSRSATTVPGETGRQGGAVVPSPMIGTVYLAPQPGAEPFVSVGASVAAGQTLLIIEAMKTLNQIPSPATGVVRQVLVSDGEAVEYGTPLAILE